MYQRSHSNRQEEARGLQPGRPAAQEPLVLLLQGLVHNTAVHGGRELGCAETIPDGHEVCMCTCAHACPSACSIQNCANAHTHLYTTHMSLPMSICLTIRMFVLNSRPINRFKTDIHTHVGTGSRPLRSPSRTTTVRCSRSTAGLYSSTASQRPAHACMRARAHARTHARTHACTQVCTHARTHASTCVRTHTQWPHVHQDQRG